MITTQQKFHIAAQRVQQRHRRMFPHVPDHRRNLHDIKLRWYQRGNAPVVAERLAK